jgi:predicted permease
MDIGFRSSGISMMSVDPRLHGYTAERTLQFLDQVRRRVAALPGVVSVACTDVLPLSGGHRSDGFAAEGRPATTAIPSADLYMATPGYFGALGIVRIAGRDFASENPAGPKVAIVNRAFAERLFPNESPIGRRVTGGGVTYQIVGVVNNINSRTIGEQTRPVLFRSLAQTVASEPSFMGYTILFRATGTSAPAAVRREIHSLDPALAVYNAETMEKHFTGALFLPRLSGALFGVFGGVGLLLSMVGLYGVMSYSVSRRTREIGIRMALGAQAGAVRRMVVRQGMTLTLIASALGLAAAWVVAKFAASLLYGIDPHDVSTFVFVPLFLAAVALLACWIPARRATRVDPLAALRSD